MAICRTEYTNIVETVDIPSSKQSLIPGHRVHRDTIEWEEYMFVISLLVCMQAPPLSDTLKLNCRQTAHSDLGISYRRQ